MMSKKYLTTKETKLYMNIGTTLLYQLINDGLIKPRKIKGKNLFITSEIDSFIEKSCADFA